MQIKVEARCSGFGYASGSLLQRMLSPLCGLNPTIGFTRRSRLDPRFIVAGAELTGVHILRHQPPPNQNSYHIGGTGIFLDEALWRALGETIERYAQMIAEISHRHRIVRATYDQIAAIGDRVVAAEKLSFFSDAQYARSRFPLRSFASDSVIGWIKAPSLLDDTSMWVPAQLVLVGYAVKHLDGEPWLLPAVTTGSAAHISHVLALRNALLELIQIDSVMGHWYSAATAPRIVLDRRTRAIERLLEKQFNRHRPLPKFHWIPNADLPGMTVACVIRQEPGVIPAVSVGLGCDLTLVEAMYKALLEAIGVVHLGKLTALEETFAGSSSSDSEIDPQGIYDLDQNVVFYAFPENSSFIDAKFVEKDSVYASDLPADSLPDPTRQIHYLAEGFQQTEKELVILDLTTADVKTLGFTALRVWSPDTLSLSLPSCPPANHPRFRAYGGFYHDIPHPYP